MFDCRLLQIPWAVQVQAGYSLVMSRCLHNPIHHRLVRRWSSFAWVSTSNVKSIMHNGTVSRQRKTIALLSVSAEFTFPLFLSMAKLSIYQRSRTTDKRIIPQAVARRPERIEHSIPSFLLVVQQFFFVELNGIGSSWMEGRIWRTSGATLYKYFCQSFYFSLDWCRATGHGLG